MKKKLLIVLLAIIVSAIVLFLVLKPEQPTVNSTGTIDLFHVEAVVSESYKLERKVKKEQPGNEINPYESEVFKGQVQQVAELYQQTAQYPIGSQPITNLADARQPKPFEETEVETPFETESGDTITVSAAVDRFQYFTNETVNLRLTLAGVPEGVFVKANASIASAKGETGLESELQNQTQNVLIASFETAFAKPNTLTTEMLIRLNIDVGGEPFFTTVGFNYNAASAQLNGLGIVRPNGANLEIPLEYSVFVSGYYFMSGILHDQKSGKPLIALQTEGRMTQGNGRLIAKAHIQALKATGSEGPYILQSIKAYRGAERGEQFDSPVSTTQPQYDIQAYEFSQYEDEDFNDPLTQERVEFLEELGKINNPTQDNE